MFKYAKLITSHNDNGFKIIDRRTNRTVGEVLCKKDGGYAVYIRGQLIGEAIIILQACYLADKYLAKAGSPQKK